ncbi:hypothetical protein [Dictyobacter arantiisoli]|uniref:Uncharacterized protein n=1 Tax=Dictyobacter arantiisoli TaxID=2014874 RepID=A0A5A5TFS6_9CHLR|nr:hypothetical protein [Dictyobacter arantiisoli]GCF10207.1 hypothetical protein KDI_37710 [Dictyobacter arantiisoli]
MRELKNLATYAAQHRIRGRSYKRNSLLKPLNIILDELDRCPDTRDENEIEFVKTSSKGLITDHVKRIARGVHTEDIYQYVDAFFDEVLEQAHAGNANFLLQRERSIRSAYVVYMRQALAEIFVARGQAKDADEAQQALDRPEADAADGVEDESA